LTLSGTKLNSQPLWVLAKHYKSLDILKMKNAVPTGTIAKAIAFFSYNSEASGLESFKP
jgi:hypothetical protein